MSPLSGGLAEVDRKLRHLQRRLNEFTVLHAVCLGMSGLALVSAGVIVLGLRAGPAIFRVGAGVAVLLVAAVGLGCALYLRRRWMDLDAAAWVADRRGHLTDRLTTLMALQMRPRSSRLVPLLVKQILTMSAGWQPDRIQSRRLPRSVFVFLGSLLVLGATAFVSRIEPPPPVSQPVPQAVPPPNTGPKPAPAAPQEGGRGGAGNQAAGEMEASTLALEDGSEVGEGETEGSSAEPGGESHPVSIAALPDRLQAAIRQAFNAQPLDRPGQLAGRAASSLDDARHGREGKEGGTGGEADGRKGADPRAESSVTGSSRLQKGDSGSGKPDAQGGKGGEPAGEEQRRSGSAPAAGSGSSPRGLMSPEGSEQGLGSEGSTRFKLTITSFLRGFEQKGKPQRPAGKHVGSAHGAAAGGGGTAALSDRQLPDDLLRKAEIPPEYEDIVRRVYSAKAGR